MKKLLFAAGILSLGFSSTFAQDVKTVAPQAQSTTSAATPQMMQKMDPKKMAQMKANRLERELSLSPEQTAKIQDIFLAEKNDGTKRVTENPDTEKQVRAILTPEQATKLDSLKAQREEAMKARRAQMQQAQQQQPAK